jgi:ubiquinone/menaquinone biosynthesis C-methylase UbiE
MKNNNKSNLKKSTPELFNGTHKYYAKYRPGIPEEVINIIVKHFNIKPSDRILDVGCGTGQVALAMEGKCKEMVCMDPDPEMLEQAERGTRDSRIKLTWINRDAKDLGNIKKEIGTFKVATICRAFHWMNQQQVLRDLDNLIDEDGGIAVFGDWSIWTGPEVWQRAVREVVQKYLGKERRAGNKTFKQSGERWEDMIARSSFKFIKIKQVPIVRNWDIENITGWLFSSSFARPDYFGDQLPAFKADIKNTLLSLDLKGVFQENTSFSMVLAGREKS